MPVAVGWFELRTTSGAQAVGGVGFEPKALVLFAGSRDGDGLAATEGARLAVGIAAADGSQSAACCEAIAKAFYPFNDAASFQSLTRVLAFGNDIPQTVATLDAFLPDGFALDVGEGGSPAAPLRVFYVALGGDLLQAAGGSFTVDAGGTDTAVTGLGFEPQLVVALTALTTPDSLDLAYGVAAPNGQWFAGLYAPDNDRGGNAADGAAALIGDGQQTWDAELASFDADGFTVSPLTPPAADTTVAYIAVRDDDPAAGFAVGSDVWADDTESPTGLGFTPQAVVFAGTFAPVDAGMFPGGGVELGAAAASAGSISADVLYQSGAFDDPYGPPRFTAQTTDGGQAANLWAPETGFGAPPANPSLQIAGLTLDSLDADGFSYTMQTDRQVTPIGDWPDNTWPALPVAPLHWLALGSGAVEQDDLLLRGVG